jgi:gliding motility-associated-like protein
LTVTGGSAGTGATAQWYTGSCGGTSAGSGNSITVSPTTNTTYYVRYEGSCNTTTCASQAVTINSNSAAPTGITGTTTLCSGSSTTLTLTGGSAGTGATAQWYTGSCGGISAGSGNSITVSPTSNTTYYVRYEGSCNTTTCASQTVTINSTSTAPTSITGTSTICSGSSTTLTVTGGSAGTGATAQWFTGSCGGTSAGSGNSITVSPTTNTTYYVRYAGTCNTTTCASQPVTVNTVPSAPTASASPSAICPGDNATLSVSGCSGTVEWYTNSGGTGTPLASTTVSPASTTTYYAYCTESGCRSATGGSVSVTVNSNPTVTVPNGGNVCDEGTLNLSPSTGGTWTSSAPTVASITNGGVVTGESAGTADMTFTNTTTGCSSTASAGTITVSPLPTFTVSTTDPSACGASDGTITISGLNASTTYQVSTASGALPPSMSNGSGEIVLTFGSGSYSPISVSLNGCTTVDNGTYELNDPSSPSITVPNGGVVCEGETLNLSPATGGTWSSNNPGVVSITNGGILTGASGGTATVTYTDGTTGCSSLASDGAITVNAAPTVTTPNGGNVCVGETLNLTPSTGGTWTSSDGTVATITNGGVVTGVDQGTATMTYTETATGCSSLASTGSITVNPLPTFTVSTTNPSSCGAMDGTITISGLDASTTYQVSTASGALSPETSNGSGEIVLTLGSGSYSPIEVSLNGCSTIDNGTYDLNDPSSPSITVPNGGQLCEGDALNLTPSTGGTWSSNDPGVAIIDNTGLLSGVSAGTATVTYTETATGCSSLASAGSITVNPIPTVTVPNGGEVCEGATLSLTPSTGGTWSSSDPTVATVTNGGVVTGVTVGTAEMTFTNTTTGCSSVASTGAITVNESPTITVPAGNAICVGSTLDLQPTTGGTWSSSDPTVATITSGGVVTGVDQGTADMVFTSTATGCSSIASNGTVIVNTTPTLTTGTINCDQSSSSFSVEYTTTAGAVVTSNVGTVTSTAVTNIPNDQSVIIVATAEGCPIAEETVSTDECDDIVIDISNGVSPNSDGMNDFFTITNLDAYPGHSLSIYNRWGDIVFETAPYENDWSGKNNKGGLGGDELPAGTYFYILELGEDIEPMKGYIELKR